MESFERNEQPNPNNMDGVSALEVVRNSQRSNPVKDGRRYGNKTTSKGTKRTQSADIAKVAREKKSKQTTFLSMEEADRLVKPVLYKVVAHVRRTHQPTVPGWLNRLRMWLVRMERGNAHDARTPFFLRMSYQSVASMIMEIVKNGAKTNPKAYSVPEFWDDLVAVEDHQSEKIGARGVFPPAHTWVDKKVGEVWKDKPPKPQLNKRAMMLALEDLKNAYKGKKLDVDASSVREGFKTAGTEDADPRSLNVDTNSCAFTFVRGWYHRIWDKSVSLVQRMVQVLIMKQAFSTWEKALKARSYKEIDLHFVATASQRTNVASGYKPDEDKSNVFQGHIMSKLRVVCAMPKLDTVLGKPILNRLMDACKTILNPDGTRVFTALTTPEQIDKNMQVALQTAHNHHLKVLSTDYSGYDATVPPWLAWEVAKAVATWMTNRMANIFLALIYAVFFQTSCITPTSIFPEGPSSVKSGAWCTNIMDSLINFVAQRYGYHAGYWGTIYNQFVQGDDALLTAEGLTPDAFEKSSDDIGFVANASKQYWGVDSLTFCQKIHFLGYPGGVYPIARAVAATVSLEDDVGIETDKGEVGQFPYVLAYRTICRLGAACFNPNFSRLVAIYKAEDKIHLGADMPAARLAKLAGSYATKYQREAIDKPWKSSGTRNGGFERQPVNRVLRGDLPPSPGIALFEWVYGVSYASVTL